MSKKETSKELQKETAHDAYLRMYETENRAKCCCFSPGWLGYKEHSDSRCPYR